MVADQGSICTEKPSSLKNTTRKTDRSLFRVLFILPSPVPQPTLQEVGVGCMGQDLGRFSVCLGHSYGASRKQECPSVKMLDSSYYLLSISWPPVGLMLLKFASEEQDVVGVRCCAAVPGSLSLLLVYDKALMAVCSVSALCFVLLLCPLCQGC